MFRDTHILSITYGILALFYAKFRLDGQAIIFAEWGYLGKGKYQRRDFRFDVLTGSSAFSAEDSLFAHMGMHEIFAPTKTYPPMTVREMADAAFGDSPIETA